MHMKMNNLLYSNQDEELFLSLAPPGLLSMNRMHEAKLNRTKMHQQYE